MLGEILFGRRVAAMARVVRENAFAYARARIVLRDSDSFGRWARCFGPALVYNQGAMRIGQDFAFGGALGPVQIATGVGALLGIGDNVTVEYGTSITARILVSIGHRVRLGPFCVVCDTDLPLPRDLPRGIAARGIMIGNDAWLGERVTVMPGVRIGARAVVAANSVVTEDIDDDALAAGSPATTLRVAPRGATKRPPRGQVQL